MLDRVKPGVKQIFERIDLDKRSNAGEDAVLDEVDQRLDWFVKKVSRHDCANHGMLMARPFPLYSVLLSVGSRP